MAGIVLHIPREVTWALHSDFAKRPATKAAKINLDGFRLFNGHDTQVTHPAVLGAPEQEHETAAQEAEPAAEQAG